MMSAALQTTQDSAVPDAPYMKLTCGGTACGGIENGWIVINKGAVSMDSSVTIRAKV